MTENKQSSGAAKNKTILRALTLVTPLLLIAPAAGCSDKISDSPNISHGEIETNPGAISDNANSGFIAIFHFLPETSRNFLCHFTPRSICRNPS